MAAVADKNILHIQGRDWRAERADGTTATAGEIYKMRSDILRRGASRATIFRQRKKVSKKC